MVAALALSWPNWSRWWIFKRNQWQLSHNRPHPTADRNSLRQHEHRRLASAGLQVRASAGQPSLHFRHRISCPQTDSVSGACHPNRSTRASSARSGSDLRPTADGWPGNAEAVKRGELFNHLGDFPIRNPTNRLSKLGNALRKAEGHERLCSLPCRG